MPIQQTGKFEFWVQRVLPQVYDDSLSYMELLNKVVHYLNDVIEQTNQLTTYTETSISQQFTLIQSIRDELAAFKNTIENDVLPENLETILDEWYQNGKLANIINDDVFNMKADTSYVNSELGKVRNRLDLIGSVQYGKYTPPSDFAHDMEFDVYRDVDGKMKHTFDFDAYTSDWTNIYIDGLNGVQSNDGLTLATPKQNFDLTIAEIEANPALTKVKLRVIGDYISRTRSAISLNTNITKHYAVVPVNEHLYMGSIEPALTWSAGTSNTYYTTRSGTVAVFDTTKKDMYGLPTKYKKVLTLTECESTKGTWYQTGSTLYVHRLNNAAPVQGETFVTVEASTLQYKFKENRLFMMKNVTLLSGTAGQPVYFEGDGTKGRVILENVKLHSSSGSANGISCENITSMWLFNCLVKDIARDGYNYHATINGNTFVFEFNCFAENCGLNDANETNNCTTGHEGIRILRVGSKGNRSKGPVLADVGGCYSICIDVEMGESLIANNAAYNKASFFFEDTVSTANPNPNGKAILINCGGGSSTTKGIGCGTSFKSAGKIVVQNFRGANISEDINLTVV